MTLLINNETIPLATDKDGVVRVGGTRVPLQTIVAAFNLGATAEEIMQQYPAVSLADIYFVIGYYLRNRAQVEEYIKEQDELVETIKQKYAVNGDQSNIRAKNKTKSPQSKTFNVNLPENYVQHIEALSLEYGIPLEKLIQNSLDELLTASVENLQKDVAYITEKNAELYKRLA
jgi:uncharacterized protein (DUF433 family)